jgi:hypothetical protein
VVASVARDYDRPAKSTIPEQAAQRSIVIDRQSRLDRASSGSSFS